MTDNTGKLSKFQAWLPAPTKAISKVKGHQYWWLTGGYEQRWKSQMPHILP